MDDDQNDVLAQLQATAVSGDAELRRLLSQESSDTDQLLVTLYEV